MEIKKTNPTKRICPFEKTISQQFQGSDICMFIADIKSVHNKKGGTISGPALLKYL
jgi:hypothetical protein